MLFSSETRRLKSAIHAQDAQLSQSIAELASAIGLGKASLRAVNVAKSHPVPVALAGATIAGAGIAYLMLRPTVAEVAAKRRGPSFAALSRWEDEGGPAAMAEEAVDALERKGNDWLEAARAAKEAAREKLLDLYERGLATAESKAAVAAEQAEEVSAAMRDGLSHLSDEAAGLALEARRKAWDAMERGGRFASRGLNEGRRIAEEHPVAASVAGVAAGVGLVALMLRGRGVLKLLGPVALFAAAAEFTNRLRRGQSVDDMADDLEEAADEALSSASKAVRSGARKAEAAGKKATRAAATAASSASRKAKSAVKTGASTARKAADKAADAIDEAGDKVADKVSDLAAAAEAAVKNGISKH